MQPAFFFQKKLQLELRGDLSFQFNGYGFSFQLSQNSESGSALKKQKVSCSKQNNQQVSIPEPTHRYILPGTIFCLVMYNKTIQRNQKRKKEKKNGRKKMLRHQMPNTWIFRKWSRFIMLNTIQQLVQLETTTENY